MRAGDVIEKENPHAPAGFFEAEAAGLRWLAAAGGARAARVVEVAPGRIVVERVVSARPDAAMAADFGRALARTHDAGAPAFGSSPEGWRGPQFIGRWEQPAADDSVWGVFYAEKRVRYFLERASRAGNLTPRDRDAAERACDLIANGAFDDDDPPARLHGDLWSGNVIFSPDGVVVIDPAAHGGHRETDLAMLDLFGAPHLEEILAGYRDAHPLREGWRERIPVHQLHPLAVHAVGHGPAYGAALGDAARRVLALNSR